MFSGVEYGGRWMVPLLPSHLRCMPFVEFLVDRLGLGGVLHPWRVLVSHAVLPVLSCQVCLVSETSVVHRRGPYCPVRQLFTGGSLVIRPAVVHRQGALCPSVRQFVTGGGPSDPSGSCSPVGASASVGSCSGQMSLSCG
jgi:hypothetical protein